MTQEDITSLSKWNHNHRPDCSFNDLTVTVHYPCAAGLERTYPISIAYAKSCPRRAQRARLMRDFTVPSGTPTISATSR